MIVVFASASASPVDLVFSLLLGGEGLRSIGAELGSVLGGATKESSSCLYFDLVCSASSRCSTLLMMGDSSLPSTGLCARCAAFDLVRVCISSKFSASSLRLLPPFRGVYSLSVASISFLLALDSADDLPCADCGDLLCGVDLCCPGVDFVGVV